MLFTALDALAKGSLPPGSSPAASPSAAAKPPVSPSASTPATKRAEHLARLLAQPGHGHTEAQKYLLAVSLLQKYSFLKPAVEQLEAVVRNQDPEATLAAKQVPDALCLTFLETALEQLYLIQQIVSKEGGECALYLPALAVVRSLLQASAGSVTVSMTDSCNKDEDAPEGAAAQAEEPTTLAAAQSTEDADVQHVAQPADDAAEPVPNEQFSLATLVACEALMVILYEAERRGRHFGGYCEYLFRDSVTQLLRAVMEVKQESTFSGGVYQLFAQVKPIPWAEAFYYVLAVVAGLHTMLDQQLVMLQYSRHQQPWLLAWTRHQASDTLWGHLQVHAWLRHLPASHCTI